MDGRSITMHRQWSGITYFPRNPDEVVLTVRAPLDLIKRLRSAATLLGGRIVADLPSD